ncbi:MAG: P-loop NTPase fold protein [Minisyncoccia bacterium]
MDVTKGTEKRPSRRDVVNQKISVAEFLVLLKAVIVGILTAEIYYLSEQIGRSLALVIRIHHYDPWEAITLCIMALVLIVVYLYIRNAWGDVKRLYKSYRFDLLTGFLLGIGISVSWGGIGTPLYRNVVTALTPAQLILLVIAPFVIGTLLVLRARQMEIANNHSDNPFFISDLEKKYMSDDLLGYSDKAVRFAERVYNDGSRDSIVFGIDAPWGIGKSTFVNFCIEHWGKQRGRVVVYKFNPLRYEDRSNLLEKFIDGLVKAIQKESYVPEIRPLASRYARLIKGKGVFSFFGINFEISPGTYTIDDALEDLESSLANLNKKVIVVVDDLDRLGFLAIKDVLFAIKKSFTLPNVSYVLCYDTENLIPADENVDKIMEFLEKFINVKIGLYLDAETLRRFVTENFDEALRDNRQIDPRTRDKIREAIGYAEEIYKSDQFYNYHNSLGDVRKLKRLINTLILLEIDKVDFENSDFDKKDLLHLLLIYINYPNVFRKIYDTESGGKRGFFSLLGPYDKNYSETPAEKSARASASAGEYRNAKEYEKYLGTLPPGAQFLVSETFTASRRLEETRIDRASEIEQRTYACFNGGLFGGGRNLQDYLNLIINLSRPLKATQYRFYLKEKNALIDGTPIEEILKDDQFSFTESESNRQQLWRVIVNSAVEFDGPTAARLITHLLDTIVNYSLFTNEKLGLGLRDDIDYFLVTLLTTAGWTDAEGIHGLNNEANIAEVAEWILGDGRHADKGVLATLATEERGPLGFYDLLAFRLFCSADRGGETFNLQRALSKHGDLAAPTEGDTRAIVIAEMREISQKVFKFFKERYVSRDINFFDAVDALSAENFMGEYFPFVRERITAGDISEAEVSNAIEDLKTRVKSFVFYQLGNTEINLGIGCGFYDEDGKEDDKGIAAAVNDYLFGQCFNPANGEKNYEHFADYLLMNLTSSLSSTIHHVLKPTIEQFTKVLDPDKLEAYWEKNATAVRNLGLEKKDRAISLGSYAALYKENLLDVYQVLDDLVATKIAARQAAGSPKKEG